MNKSSWRLKFPDYESCIKAYHIDCVTNRQFGVLSGGLRSIKISFKNSP